MPQNVFESTWKIKYAKSKNFCSCTDGKKTKFSSNPNNILKSTKIFYEKLYAKQTTSKTATFELFGKTSNREKNPNEQFHLCEATISLAGVIKPVNFQANNKSPGNYGLTAELYKRFLY